MRDANERLLSIVRSRFETPNIVVLELSGDGGEALPAWTPGAHIDLVLPSGKSRQYSLCGNPSDRSRYCIAVLRETMGRGGSLEIHEIARKDMVLTVRGPRNHFELVEAKAYLFIAGGIGITPMLPMIRAAEAAGAPWRLVYGGRSKATMGFFNEILERQGGAVTLLPEDEAGRPDLDALLATVGSGEVVYGCGPGGMLTALEEASVRRGLSNVLHIERFGAAENMPPPADLVGDSAFEVELRTSGITLQVPPDRSLGDTLLDAGIPVPFSCQEGYCGSCETRVLEGVPDHRDTILTDEEKAEGTLMMVCCGRSKTPRLVLDL
ncbi:oxidoreductase [Tianweitania sp. Rool2]|uniref:Oxidoreductase n=2 Tax=Oryzicola mucosus TaxID=2767425 RepID=A0A8J6PZ53_9HYPH|nr:oxidoreductase [Oryzicola mucosus]